MPPSGAGVQELVPTFVQLISTYTCWVDIPGAAPHEFCVQGMAFVTVNVWVIVPAVAVIVPCRKAPDGANPRLKNTVAIATPSGPVLVCSVEEPPTNKFCW